MTRENALKLVPIIKAYGEGKEIERYSEPFGYWTPSGVLDFSQDAENYRVKQNPNRTIKDGLEYGDIIVSDAAENKVLGVCGEVIHISYNDDFTKAVSSNYTIHELIEEGWRLSTETAPNKITLTKQEIADKFGCDVNNLEIKE